MFGIEIISNICYTISVFNKEILFIVIERILKYIQTIYNS